MCIGHGAQPSTCIQIHLHTDRSVCTGQMLICFPCRFIIYCKLRMLSCISSAVPYGVVNEVVHPIGCLHLTSCISVALAVLHFIQAQSDLQSQHSLGTFPWLDRVVQSGLRTPLDTTLESGICLLDFARVLTNVMAEIASASQVDHEISDTLRKISALILLCSQTSLLADHFRQSG